MAHTLGKQIAKHVTTAVRSGSDDAARIITQNYKGQLGGPSNLDMSTMLRPPTSGALAVHGGPSERALLKRKFGKGMKGLDDTVETAFEARVNAAEELSNKAGLYTFFGQMGIPAIGGALAFGGAKLGSSHMESAGKAVKSLEHVTFEQVGQKTGILGDMVAGVTKPVFSVLGMGASALEATGVPALISSRHARKFEGRAAKLGGHMEKLLAYEASHPELAEALGDVRAAMGNSMHEIHFENLGEALGKTRGLAEEHAPGLLKLLKPVEKAAEAAEKSHILQHGWGNLAANTRNAPALMGKSPILHGVMNASFIAGAAASDYHTASDLHKALKHLRAMYANMTGQDIDDVSGLKLMTGKVPEPVAIARSEILKEFGPAVVLDAANTVLNIKMAASSKLGSMIALIGLPLANQFLVRGMLGGHLLDTYAELKKAESTGHELTPDAYAKLAGEVSEELRQRGGADSNFAKALGYIYAQKKYTVDEVLQEVDNGKMTLRIAKLQHDYNSFKEESHKEQFNNMQTAHAANHTHESGPGDDEPGISHVDRLHRERNGTMAADKEREVIGKHTEMLSARKSHENQHHTPGQA